MALSDARSKLVRRLHRRKTRERESLVLVEGPHASGEALAADVAVRFAVVSPRLQNAEGDRLRDRLVAADVDLHEVEDHELAALTDTETPQGVLLVVEEPAYAWPEARTDGRWLLLDAIQDPGNVGTLIRAAAAFACKGVVTLDGTADPWGAKAVRSSAGAVFHVPIHVARSRPLREVMEALPTPLLAAEMGGGDPRKHVGAHWTLAVGNEGAGIRPELLDVADARVAVPMAGGIESLNAAVAGAILLYALSGP